MSTPFGTASLAVAAILGLLSLFFGRQLFYVFVALVGFVIGFALGRALLGAPNAPALAPSVAAWAPLIVGIIGGVLVALLAVFLQRPIAALSAFAVFFGAGREIFGAASAPIPLVAAVILGLIALVLVWIFFDWGLIVSSAFIGAAVLVAVAGTLTTLPVLLALLLFAVLFVLGALFQARNLGA